MRSQRMILTALNGTRAMADLTWLPWDWVSDPQIAATRGWLPHRLLSSTILHDLEGNMIEYRRQIGLHMYRPNIQKQRLAVFLDTAFETVREIGITWDFPALALFWLHMGFAAVLATLLDGLRQLCPNVYTRPFDYIDAIDRKKIPGLRHQWIEALSLQANPEPMALSLKRIHAQISAKFPEPVWPENMRTGTRFEYRYWSSPEEIAWRISVAAEMARRGDSASAVFYLRFCAYAVARIPMVHACARAKQNVSFLRPECAVLPQLQNLAPEIVDDLESILGGTISLDSDEITKSLEMLLSFRDDSLSWLRARGAPTPELQDWKPYRPEAA
ncbi:MAG: hypothetical protein WBY53_15845 [Acidobacteriaceae bacterium]